MNAAPNTYTAAQLAEHLGKQARVVRRALANIRPDAERMVRGNLTSAWQIESLPQPMRDALETLAGQRGLKSVHDLFNRPAHLPADWAWCEPWQPEIPFTDVCAEQQAEAVKLQRALLPLIERRNDASRLGAEFDLLGVQTYQREFQSTINPARWRYLFDRTLERDRGAGQFHRVELFLPGNLKRAPAAALAQTPPDEFRRLHDLILSFANPQAPSADEKALLWKRAFEFLQPLMAAHRQFKRARRRLLNFLWSCAPWLAKSPNALRVSLDRHLAKGFVNDGVAAAFADGRNERRGIPTAQPYDPEQVALIKFASAEYLGGHSVAAARELNEAGKITDPRIKRQLDTASSKSYLRASLRAELKDVEAWRIAAKGERYARKMKPRRKLRYDGIFSMTALVGDDKTPDLYIAVPDGNGWWTPMRPQLILISDYRSDFILGHGITPTPQYKVMDFLGPFKRIFKKRGLPQFIVREGGLWRNSHLANSMADIGKATNERNLHRFSPAEIEYGLERKGICFVNSLKEMEEKIGSVAIKFRESYNPNSKPVEGVIRLLTQFMERLPCYSGRDERYDCPQKTREAVAAVKSHKASPHEVGMLVWDQWRETIQALIAKHNSAKQEGRRLRNPLTGAPMSPEEAFEVFQNLSDPPAAFDAECEVLLSHVQQEVTVRAPNLRRRQFPCGFVELRGNTYCNEETGKRIGKKLLAHWDPEFPETCTFTDMNLRNPFTVPRLEPNNALFPDPQTAITSAQAQRTINVVRAEYRATKTKFDSVVRQAIVAPLVKELNSHVAAETKQITERKQAVARKRQNVSARAGKLGNAALAALARNSDPRDTDQIDEGLQRMATALRDEAQPDAEAATPPAPAKPGKKDYFIKPFPEGNQS